jgi:hypothetical protein
MDAAPARTEERRANLESIGSRHVAAAPWVLIESKTAANSPYNRGLIGLGCRAYWFVLD